MKNVCPSIELIKKNTNYTKKVNKGMIIWIRLLEHVHMTKMR